MIRRYLAAKVYLDLTIPFARQNRSYCREKLPHPLELIHTFVKVKSQKCQLEILLYQLVIKNTTGDMLKSWRTNTHKYCCHYLRHCYLYGVIYFLSKRFKETFPFFDIIICLNGSPVTDIQRTRAVIMRSLPQHCVQAGVSLPFQ